MSMHLHHPSLSLNGKKKGKKKWASAEAKRQAEQLQESWNEIVKKYSPSNKIAAKTKKLSYSLSIPENRSTKHIPSVDSGTGNATKAAPKVYTGTKVKGIATMHKSNAVPVFSDEEAVEISKMRRG
jgi:hypothetical protein